MQGNLRANLYLRKGGKEGKSGQAENTTDVRRYETGKMCLLNPQVTRGAVMMMVVVSMIAVRVVTAVKFLVTRLIMIVMMMMTVMIVMVEVVSVIVSIIVILVAI